MEVHRPTHSNGAASNAPAAKSLLCPPELLSPHLSRFAVSQVPSRAACPTANSSKDWFEPKSEEIIKYRRRVPESNVPLHAKRPETWSRASSLERICLLTRPVCCLLRQSAHIAPGGNQRVSGVEGWLYETQDYVRGGVSKDIQR